MGKIISWDGNFVGWNFRGVVEITEVEFTWSPSALYAK